MAVRFNALAFEPSREAGRLEEHLLQLPDPPQCRSLSLSRPDGLFDQGLCFHWSFCLTSSCYCCLLQEALPDRPVEKSCAFLFRCSEFKFSPLPHPSLSLSLSSGCVMVSEILHLSDSRGFLSVHWDGGGKKRKVLWHNQKTC